MCWRMGLRSLDSNCNVHKCISVGCANHLCLIWSFLIFCRKWLQRFKFDSCREFNRKRCSKRSFLDSIIQSKITDYHFCAHFYNSFFVQKHLCWLINIKWPNNRPIKGSFSLFGSRMSSRCNLKRKIGGNLWAWIAEKGMFNHFDMLLLSFDSNGSNSSLQIENGGCRVKIRTSFGAIHSCSVILDFALERLVMGRISEIVPWLEKSKVWTNPRI